METLGLDWGEIHDEAEELEHAISEKVLEKLDEFLGRPSHDPHGDPIPTKRGTMPSASSRTLLDCEAGDDVRIESIQDQGKEFLQFARKKKLTPVKKLKWCKTTASPIPWNLKFRVKLFSPLVPKRQRK